MNRVLKPQGRLLIADTFKPQSFSIADKPELQRMLNGWAIGDIHSVDEMEQLARENGFRLLKKQDQSDAVKRSVKMMFWAGLAGAVGTWFYNLFKDGTHFSRVHYQTGIAQKRAFDQGLWRYYLLVFEKL